MDPPRTWGVRGIDGPIRAAVNLTVEPLTDGTSRLTIAVDFEGHGIGKILVPLLVRRQAQKEMPANLATLKDRIEPSSRNPGHRQRPSSTARTSSDPQGQPALAMITTTEVSTV